MNILQDLQSWYHSHCNGEWEHSYGIKIDTLDNPGWTITIDLADTDLTGRSFTKVNRVEHKVDWIICVIRDGKFEGTGGPFMLEEILRIFLKWAAETQGFAEPLTVTPPVIRDSTKDPHAVTIQSPP